MKIAARSSIALGLIACLSFATPSLAQGLQDLADLSLEEAETWDQLCEITDCDQIPLGYNTYVLGPEVYYFPTFQTVRERGTGGVGGLPRGGRYFDGPARNQPTLRSLSNWGQLNVQNCCDVLLRFFGLADAMPQLRDTPTGDRLAGMRLTVTRYDETPFFWEGTDHSFEEVASELSLRYNDDFWIVLVTEPEPEDSRGIRSFRLLSTRPLIHGRHVLVGCRELCSIVTWPSTGEEGETRPNVRMRWLGLGVANVNPQNIFLCSLEEIENGCDPRSTGIDAIPEMLAVVEDMLEAAQVFPEGR